MPGGSWGLQTKFLSHELNCAHFTQLRQDCRSGWYEVKEKGSTCRMYSLFNCSLPKPKSLFDQSIIINKRFISLSSLHFNTDKGESQPEKESGKSKLKKAIKQYGSTVIVFHISISLVSLGLFYFLVSW